MTRRADIIITCLFLLFFGFYTFFGFVFGGMGGENNTPYILATVSGLILLLASLRGSSIKRLTWTRILGLLLVASLLYFDLKSQYTFETFWNNFLSVLTYFPTIAFLSYLTSSIIRLRSARKQYQYEYYCKNGANRF